MVAENRPSIWIVLTLGVLPVVSGCPSKSREWKWERCYEGKPRELADVSVLLVARDRLPLRARSIDGDRVRERTEYHLLPGDHLVVSRPDGQLPLSLGMGCPGVTYTIKAGRKGKIKGDDQEAALTLKPGVVYRLTAELAWEEDEEEEDHVVWRSGKSTWSPRLEPLGSVEEVKNALARRQAFFEMALRGELGAAQAGDIPRTSLNLGTSERPPEHWSIADPEKSENPRK